MSSSGGKKRYEFYFEPELRAIAEKMAKKRRLTLAKYVNRAVEEQLSRDGEKENSDGSANRKKKLN